MIAAHMSITRGSAHFRHVEVNGPAFARLRFGGCGSKLFLEGSEFRGRKSERSVDNADEDNRVCRSCTQQVSHSLARSLEDAFSRLDLLTTSW
jgi:hypothetical protein